MILKNDIKLLNYLIKFDQFIFFIYSNWNEGEELFFR